MNEAAQRIPPPLTPAILQWIRSKPYEWRADLVQEAHAILLELSNDRPEDDEALIEAQCLFALAHAYRTHAHLIDLLPTRACRRLYRALQDEGPALLVSQAEALAEKYQSQPGLIRHVIRVIQMLSGGGAREDIDRSEEMGAVFDPFEGLDTKGSLDKALSGLTEREREIIAHRYFEEPSLSQGEVASSLGISQPRVHTLEKRALEKMREMLAP